MLHNENNYIKDLKTTIDKVPQNCEKFQVVIYADGKPANDRRQCFNAAIANEVALVVV